jgi:hypothetical protein
MSYAKQWLPKGMVYGNWYFSIAKLRDLTFEIEIGGQIGRRPGRYLQLYDRSRRGHWLLLWIANRRF